jgi:hypothetical protein
VDPYFTPFGTPRIRYRFERGRNFFDLRYSIILWKEESRPSRKRTVTADYIQTRLKSEGNRGNLYKRSSVCSL